MESDHSVGDDFNNKLAYSTVQSAWELIPRTVQLPLDSVISREVLLPNEIESPAISTELWIRIPSLTAV